MGPSDLSESTRNVKDTQVEFILTELRTGLTLASVAENGGRDKEKSRTHARAAYDSALRFRERLPLTQDESQRVQSKLEELKKRLEGLGEKF